MTLSLLPEMRSAASSRPPSALDGALEELHEARVALAAGDGERARAALAAAFGELGAAYAALDATERPEVTACLQAVYDRCLRYIGDAAPGQTRGLDAAIALLSPVRDALAASSTRPESRPRESGLCRGF